MDRLDSMATSSRQHGYIGQALRDRLDSMAAWDRLGEIVWTAWLHGTGLEGSYRQHGCMGQAWMDRLDSMAVCDRLRGIV